jgi:hypothetical protein
MGVELEAVARAASVAAHRDQRPLCLFLDLWVEGPELLAVLASSFDGWSDSGEWVVFLTNFWTKLKTPPNFDLHWTSSLSIDCTSSHSTLCRISAVYREAFHCPTCLRICRKKQLFCRSFCHSWNTSTAHSNLHPLLTE